jgi:sugar transferase (PEP-CTERM/EpsH1 system associated)
LHPLGFRAAGLRVNMERPVLIAHLIHRLDYGGLENGLVNLVNRMSAQRYRHAIVCLAGYGDFRRRIARPDVEVVSVDKRDGKDPRAYLRILRQLRRLRPDVVHTRNLGTVDLQWLALGAGVRHRVHGEHGFVAEDPTGLEPRTLRIRRACRPAIQRYVAMSRDIAGWLERDVRVPHRRISQIYNGVDTGLFRPGAPTATDVPWRDRPRDALVVFGTVGRLDRIKNQVSLLEALHVVAQDPGRREHLRLIVAGDGPLRDELAATARRLAIDDLVWFAGARRDVPGLLRALDVFVLPSRNEGISNTILEAMASGLPVIATRVGGNPELVVDGSTGTLYDPADAVALAATLRRYADDEGLRRNHGASGRRRVEQDFGLDGMVGRYEELYERLLAGRAD